MSSRRRSGRRSPLFSPYIDNDRLVVGSKDDDHAHPLTVDAIAPLPALELRRIGDAAAQGLIALDGGHILGLRVLEAAPAPSHGAVSPDTVHELGGRIRRQGRREAPAPLAGGRRAARVASTAYAAHRRLAPHQP